LEKLKFMLHYAILAPFSHNTQPSMEQQTTDAWIGGIYRSHPNPASHLSLCGSLSHECKSLSTYSRMVLMIALSLGQDRMYMPQVWICYKSNRLCLRYNKGSSHVKISILIKQHFENHGWPWVQIPPGPYFTARKLRY
jgi:hypothetical protein